MGKRRSERHEASNGLGEIIWNPLPGAGRRVSASAPQADVGQPNVTSVDAEGG